MSLGEVYARGRARITGVAEAAGDRAAATRVPACPQWSVHDVVAHLAGACDDILTGNLEGVATDAWTAAQVGKRRGASIADVLAEWAELAPRVEAIADTFPEPYGPQLITDLVTHEHDIRGVGVRSAPGADRPAHGRPDPGPPLVRRPRAVPAGVHLRAVHAPGAAAGGLGPL
jgi:hypothetical protein